MTISNNTPWNKGRSVGARQALTRQEVSQIKRRLTQEKLPHDLCLFMVAIDTMLRASDLLQLRVRDVQLPNGHIRQTFPWRQKKTTKTVYPVLTKRTQTTLAKWIRHSQKRNRDYLFTREKPTDANPISIGFYRTLIKGWVRLIGLPRQNYSAHSLRRSKAIFMYENGVTVEIIGRLLGHKSSASTIHYLGIDEAEARAQALAFDIFNTKHVNKNTTPSQFSESEIEYLSAQIWLRLADKITHLFDEITQGVKNEDT